VEHPNLLQDFAWILLSAGLVSILFQQLRLPLILGYVVAGLLIGPNLLPFSPIHELENIHSLSELGVIFLMFYIGLEFDFSRLKSILPSALLALVMQTLLMLTLGIQISQWLGWSAMNGLFLGGLLSISSSMVAVKLIKDKGDLNRPYANLTVGILVLEDILAILLLVILTGVALTGGFEWQTASQTSFFVGMFVIFVFIIGKLFAKPLIKMLEDRGSTELISMTTLGAICGLSLLAAKFHFSLALGGFLAGAILSNTRLAHRIEELTEPLRDLFSAIFFVSVGMLLDPKLIFKFLPIILLVSATVVLGKFITCWLGLFLTGNAPQTSARASLAKVQIGEFSFVIAALGTQLAVTDEKLHAVASGVAFMTILITPLSIRFTEAMISTGQNLMPHALREFSRVYHNWFEAIRHSFSSNYFLSLASKPFGRIAIHFFLINGILIGTSYISLRIEWDWGIPFINTQQILFLAGALLCIPLLVDTFRNLNILVLLFTESTLNQKTAKQFSKGIYKEVFNKLILLFVSGLYGLIFLIVSAPYFPTGTTVVVFFLLNLLLAVLFWRRLVHMHHQFESALIDSLHDHAKDMLSGELDNALTQITQRDPWPVKMESYTIEAQSVTAGKSIKELKLRNLTGATIASIEREGLQQTEITPDTVLFPRDKLLLLGEPDQLKATRKLLGESRQHRYMQEAQHATAPSLRKLLIPHHCDWTGIPLKKTPFKSQYGVNIAGIQRGKLKLIGPGPEEWIQEDDLILVLGLPRHLDELEKAMLEVST